MTRGNRISPWPLLAAACGFVLILASTSRFGAGVSPDSTSYLSAAESFAQNATLMQYSGHTLTNYPPLYPLLLSLFKTLGFPFALSFASWLNALAFGMAVALAARLPDNGSRSEQIAASLLMLCSFPFFKLSTMAWSEPVFMLLMIPLLIQLRNYDRSPSPRKAAMVGLWLALLCLQRYAGAVLALGAAFTIFIIPHPRRIFHAAMCILVSFAPLSLWITRNYAVASSYKADLNIHDTIGTGAFIHNVSTCLRAVKSLLGLVGIVGLLLAGTLALIIWILFVSRERKISGSNLFSGLSVMCGGYVLFALSYLALTPAEVSRYLFVLYVPMVFFISSVLKQFTLRVRTSVIILLCSIQVVPVALTVVRNIDQGAGGYNRKHWLERESSVFLRMHPLQGRVISNAPDFYYFLTRSQCTLAPKIDQPPVFSADRVVWFDGIRNRDYLRTEQQLLMSKAPDSVIVLSDARIYFFGP